MNLKDSHISHSHSTQTAQTLYEASLNTLRSKHQHKGGHTGWSAAWESLLFSRSDFVTVIQPLLYLTSYLLSYHDYDDDDDDNNNNNNKILMIVMMMMMIEVMMMMMMIEVMPLHNRQ